MEKKIRFNELRILQSLNPGEKSGSRLYEDLYLYPVKHPKLTVLLDEFETEEELMLLFEDIKRRIKEDKRFPIIHLEVHGDKRGIELLSGTYITYEVLVRELVAINVLTRNNLVISMGVCFGSFISLDILKEGVLASQRSAFVALIAPETEVTDHIIYDSFRNFYIKLFDGDNFMDAAKDMDEKHGLYFLYAPEMMIKKIILGMKEMMNSADFKSDARRNLEASLNNNNDPLPGKTYQKKLTHMRKLMRVHYESGMNKIWNKFLMIDLFPENADRFESFEEVWNENLNN